jgi:hypothetical protein
MCAVRMMWPQVPKHAAPPSARNGRPSAHGFSLLEVVIAGALLLLTVTGTTACVTAASRAAQRSEGAMAADQALASIATRLMTLPFCPAELPAPVAARGPGAADLVSVVFPHADEGAGAEGDRFIAVSEDGLPAGSFVTSLSFDDIAVVCVARFRDPAGSWLGPDDLAGWDVRTDAQVPSAVLALELRAPTFGRPRSYRFERRAGVGALLESATRSL